MLDEVVLITVYSEKFQFLFVFKDIWTKLHIISKIVCLLLSAQAEILIEFIVIDDELICQVSGGSDDGKWVN